MKVILYMAITVNGMIAKKDGDSDWVSEEDNKNFTEKCRECGVVIMGRKTYEVLSPDFLPLKKGRHIVLTRNSGLNSDNKTVEFVNKNPSELLKELEKEGIEMVCLIGGQETVTNFIRESLVNEIYLDIEPLIFGDGIHLFAPSDFDLKLKLLEVKKLSSQTIQLHYKVLKN